MVMAAMRIWASGRLYGAVKHAMDEQSGEIFLREMRRRRELLLGW
jgi:hypothetical protein